MVKKVVRSQVVAPPVEVVEETVVETPTVEAQVESVEAVEEVVVEAAPVVEPVVVAPKVVTPKTVAKKEEPVVVEAAPVVPVEKPKFVSTSTKQITKNDLITYYQGLINYTFQGKPLGDISKKDTTTLYELIKDLIYDTCIAEEKSMPLFMSNKNNSEIDETTFIKVSKAEARIYPNPKGEKSPDGKIKAYLKEPTLKIVMSKEISGGTTHVGYLPDGVTEVSSSDRIILEDGTELLKSSFSK